MAKEKEIKINFADNIGNDLIGCGEEKEIKRHVLP